MKNGFKLFKKLKGKTGVLTRTLEILQSRDPTLELALLNHQKLNISDELSMNDDTNPETLSKKSTDELIQV